MKMLETIIACVVCLVLGGGGGWILSDINDQNKPAKVQNTPIITEVKTDITTKSEMQNFQVQETALYQEADKALILSFTNQTAYSNLLKSIVTNSNVQTSKTNQTNFLTTDKK